ncbi:MAG: molecular chaperone DnaJ [bacterium]
MSKRDYYEVLGVGQDADADEIKRAFRRLAREYHPDVNKDEGAEEQFKELSEAYTALSDNEKRATYDRYGHAGVNDMNSGSYSDFSAGFGGLGEIFDVFFGGGRTSARVMAEDGRDLRIDLDITFDDVLSGSQRKVTFQRMETCSECDGTGAKSGSSPTICPECRGAGQIRHMRQTMLGQVTQVVPCGRCGGNGQIISDPCTTCEGSKRIRREINFEVKVPAGSEDGLTLRYSHEGDAGRSGGRPGDLYAVLHLPPDKRFTREGTEIFRTRSISFVKATLGGKVKLAGIDAEHELEIPAGTQPNTEFRIAGAGLPPVGGGVRGALHVSINIKVPKTVNETQRNLLRQFAIASNESVESIADQGEKTFLEKFKDKISKSEEG